MEIEVVGLGYVGLPLALRLAKKYQVVGVDKNQERIKTLSDGIDINEEYSSSDLNQENLTFLYYDDAAKKQCDAYIVTVPTPIDDGKKPDLKLLRDASAYIGSKLKAGDIVSYESTVFPGATNEVCVPILEEASGLKANVDFEVGYSPERVSPGKSGKRIEEITKVISSNTETGLSLMHAIYSEVTDMGLFEAKSIEVAEFSKVLENTQRDLNIALVNEVSHICNRLDIKTNDVLAAASTKWNFLNFKPGLVGGHCIGVDPYYLLYRAEQLGYMPEVVAAGRRVNEKMADFAARQVLKKLLTLNKAPSDLKVGIFGMTFKEDCPDYRNSKSFNILHYFSDYSIRAEAFDVYHEKFAPEMAMRNYPDENEKFDAIIIAVNHSEYKEKGLDYFSSLLIEKQTPILFDVKGIFGSDLCLEL